MDDLIQAAEEPSQKLQNFDGKIYLVGQYDADGISATSIAHQLLTRLGKDFEYEIVKQLYEEDIDRLAENREEDLLFFVDTGSGQSQYMQERLVEEEGKQVVISDHHDPQIEGDFPHFNPHFEGYDGGEAISAAGMTYILAKQISSDNQDLIPFALIGAAGDIQKQEGEFLGLNTNLVEEAVNNNYIEKRKGLDLYGRTTKPLHKSLMYTSDPHLEGITNNESGAIQAVKEAGVNIRENGEFKTLSDLQPEEEKKLIHNLITNGHDVEKLLNNIYTLENGYEIDEYSTIINACGRLGEPRKGVKILLENDQNLAEKISRKYGRKISKSLKYAEKNKENEEVIYEEEIGVLDAEDNIEDDFIGTVTTIIMSNGFYTAPVVAGFAHTEKNKIKVSTRGTKKAVENGLNLGETIEKIIENTEGEGGGHNIAAGAKIPRENKQQFIEDLKNEVKQAVS